MVSRKVKKIAWRLVHLAIIINFVLNIAYCALQVFVVFNPGTGGPLFGGAVDMELDFFLKRRLYAIEFWITFLGFAIYMALTEILPARQRLENDSG